MLNYHERNNLWNIKNVKIAVFWENPEQFGQDWKFRKNSAEFWESLRTQTRCLEENDEKHERERKTRKEEETNREAPVASLRMP